MRRSSMPSKYTTLNADNDFYKDGLSREIEESYFYTLPRNCISQLSANQNTGGGLKMNEK